MAPKTKPIAKSQRTKAIAAAILAVVMLVVVASNFVGAGDEFEATTLGPLPNAGPVLLPAATGTPPPAVAEARPQQPPLPPISLPRVLAHNPFLGRRGAVIGDSEGAAPANTLASSSAGTGTIQAFPSAEQADASFAATASELPDAAQADSLPTLRVTAIVTGGGRPAALIGDRLFHENDVIEDRWRIDSIHSQGIVVHPVATHEAP